MGEERFLLYCKASADGQEFGDCPFSQRSYMCTRIKIPEEQFKMVPVNITDKPEWFTQISTTGKVPLFVDTKTGKTISDSADINLYINSLFPDPSVKMDCEGPACEAVNGIFPKLGPWLKNKDPSKDLDLKNALLQELSKMETYLSSGQRKGTFLLSDELSDLDLSILPKLLHLMVAGKVFKKFEIPSEKYPRILEYIENGHNNEFFIKTRPKDKEIIWGWQQHM